MHLIAPSTKLMIPLASAATARTTTTSAEVARDETTCALPATPHAAPDTTQYEEQDERGNSEEKQLPPDLVLADEGLLPERVLSAAYLRADSKLSSHLTIKAFKDQDEIVVGR